MADDDDDSIRIGQREAGSVSRDLEATILEFLEPMTLPLCDDDDSNQTGHREADSVSGEPPSTLLDLLELENPLLQPLLSEASISQEDVEPVTEWAMAEDVEPVMEWAMAKALEPVTVTEWATAEVVEPMTVTECAMVEDVEPVTECAMVEDVEPVTEWATAEDVEPVTEWDTTEDVEPVTECAMSEVLEPVTEWDTTEDVELMRGCDTTEDVEPATEWATAEDVESATECAMAEDVEPVMEWATVEDVEPVTEWAIAEDVEPVTEWDTTENVESATECAMAEDVEPVTEWDTTEDVEQMRGWDTTEDVEPVREWDTAEDVELETECETLGEVTLDPSGVMPRLRTEEDTPDRDVDIFEDSIEKMFEESLISNSAFALEKILGESTAKILTEAEAEASKFATKLRDRDIKWDLETKPHSILTCEICQLFVRTVDRLLDKRDRLRNQYLPLTEEEICSLKIAIEELDDEAADHETRFCLARINNLSGKLRQRAYMMTLNKLRMARRNTQESLCQLHQTIDLIGQVRQEVRPECHQSYRKLSAITVEWTQRRSSMTPTDSLKKVSKKSTPRSSIVEELGSPLAQSSIEKVRIPDGESSHIGKEKEEEDEEEVTDSYRDTGTPPKEYEEEAPAPLPEMSFPEPELPMPTVPPLTPLAEPVDKDVANITISAPGCDDDPDLTSNMPTETDAADLPASQMEAQALQMSRSLALNLQDTYENLLANLQDLPAHLQKKLNQTCERMGELQSSFDSAHNFGDLSRSILKKSFDVVAEAQSSMDELMEYALQSPKALLWLKDHLPVPEDETGQEPAPGGDGLLPTEGEAVPPDMERKNILEIQEIYDPQRCEDGTLLGEEKEVAPPSPPQDLEDILETQQAYDPKGCEDYSPSKEEHEEVQPPSKQEWNILETLQSYIPRLPDKGDVSSEEKEETQPSENEEVEEEREVDILKLQRAHDPQSCEDRMPSGEDVAVEPSPSQTEWKDILEIQQDYDPKGCVDATPPSKPEAAPSGQREDWNILGVLQTYVPKIYPKEAPPAEEKKEVATTPTLEEEEVPGRDILETQRAHDPQGCREEVEVQPSSRWESASILEIQAMYDPNDCKEGAPLSEGGVVPPPGKPESEDILKVLQAYEPRGCDEEPPPRKEEATPPSDQEEWNLLKMLQAYVSRSSIFELPSSKEKKPEVEPSKHQVGKERSILKNHHVNNSSVSSEKMEKAPPLKMANVLKTDCEEGVPFREESEEGAPFRKESEEGAPSRKESAPSRKESEKGAPSRKESEEGAQSRKESEKGAPSRKESEKGAPSRKESEKGAPSRKESEKGAPSRKESEEGAQSRKESAPSRKESEKGAPSRKESEKGAPSRKESEKGDPSRKESEKGAPSRKESEEKVLSWKEGEEGAPSRKEGEEAVRPPGKVEAEDILKIQRAYDPMDCEDDAPSWKERKEDPPSGKQEEWNIMKFFQSYIPQSRTDEASAAAVEAKGAGSAASPLTKPVPPSPSRREVKEAVPPARKWEVPEWDILKIQEAHDPQGCKEDDG